MHAALMDQLPRAILQCEDEFLFYRRPHLQLDHGPHNAILRGGRGEGESRWALLDSPRVSPQAECLLAGLSRNCQINEACLGSVVGSGSLGLVVFAAAPAKTSTASTHPLTVVLCRCPCCLLRLLQQALTRSQSYFAAQGCYPC